MITTIKINQVASYSQEVIIEDLKKINFFFGNNGSGKSTVAKFFYNLSSDNDNKSSIVYDNCSQFGFDTINDEILVFNDEFIQRNFINNNVQKGIFSLNQGNDIIDKLIEAETLKLNQNKKFKDENLKEKKEIIESQVAKDYSDLKKNCFELRKNTLSSFLKIKDSFPYKQTQNNFDKINSILFTTKNLIEIKYENLLTNYKKLYDEELVKIDSLLSTKTYKQIRKIEIKINDLLNEVIIGNNDVDIAKMINDLGIRNWVDTGRDFLVKDLDSQICPFCQKETIDSNLLSKFESYFDENYKNKLAEIELLKGNYTTFFNDFLGQIDNVTKEYNFKNKSSNLYKDLKLLFQKNINSIDEKIKISNEKKQIKSILDFKNIISEVNKSINSHNKDFENLDNNRKKFEIDIWNYLTLESKENIQNYDLKKYEYAIDYLFELNIEEYIDEIILESKSKIEGWKTNTITTQEAVDNINSILRNSGFGGFKIKEKEKVNNISQYFLKRVDSESTQNVFKTLSEGEKNFIAFLYFHQLCLGTGNTDDISKKKIIVIDDPISSLDSQSLFIITTLIRDLSKKKGKNKIENKEFYYSHIHQIFVFTHNIYFFKEVSISNGNKLCQEISYFKIRKIDKESEVSLMPYNEINNDYSLLWKTLGDLKKSSSSDLNIIICNTMRRILESYINFTKIGQGKDSWDVLSTIPLEDPRHFVFSALISEINDGSHKVSLLDDVYFHRIINISTENIFFVFKEIFKEIGESHYEAMMN